MGHMTLITHSLQCVVCHANAWHVLHLYKIWWRSDDMIWAHKNFNRSRDLTTPLAEVICHPWTWTCLPTKYEVTAICLSRRCVCVCVRVMPNARKLSFLCHTIFLCSSAGTPQSITNICIFWATRCSFLFLVLPYFFPFLCRALD